MPEINRCQKIILIDKSNGLFESFHFKMFIGNVIVKFLKVKHQAKFMGFLFSHENGLDDLLSMLMCNFNNFKL